MTRKKHQTYHFSDPDDEGKVLCRCEHCPWTALVSVKGKTWVEGMEVIFAARDAHEIESVKPTPPVRA